MPWRETCTMHQRIAFVAACLRDEAPMSVLCEAFGISRKTGYKSLARYRADGTAGLAERLRAPQPARPATKRITQSSAFVKEMRAAAVEEARLKRVDDQIDASLVGRSKYLRWGDVVRTGK